MVTEQLQGYDVEQALEAVDGLRHADGFDIPRDALVTFVTYHDRLRLARGNLSEGRLDLGIERVTCHDDDHGHILIDKRERAVLEFASEDALTSQKTQSAAQKQGFCYRRTF